MAVHNTTLLADDMTQRMIFNACFFADPTPPSKSRLSQRRDVFLLLTFQLKHAFFVGLLQEVLAKFIDISIIK